MQKNYTEGKRVSNGSDHQCRFQRPKCGRCIAALRRLVPTFRTGNFALVYSSIAWLRDLSLVQGVQERNCDYPLFIRRLLENYCFVLPTNRAPPQISDDGPDMRQTTLFVTSRAAWRWNNMLLAWENVDSPLAAMVLATEHNAL